MRRIVEIGSRRFTEVVCLDEPGAGGACHEYEVLSVAKSPAEPQAKYAQVSFQRGPIQEHGVNGCHQEDLLAILIDRLRHFQRGPYSCMENALALTFIRTAMLWLNKRTEDRQRRGVEGTSQP